MIDSNKYVFKTFVIFPLFLLILNPCYAKTSGNTSASFLLIDPGARSTAMGGAQVAVSEGLDATYWNPAALGRFQRKEVSASYLSYFEEINFGNTSLAIPTKSFGAFGLRFSLLDSGSIQKTDIRASKTGTFNTRDMIAGPMWGMKISENFSIGTNLKYISQSVDGVSATGYGLDAGGLYSIWPDRLSLGVALQNIGTKIKDKSLPTAALFGLAFQPTPTLTFSGQGDYALNGPTIGRFGVEYKFLNMLPIRVGYKADKDNLNTVSFGGGIIVRQSLFVDYAFGLVTDIDNIHRISLTYRFGNEIMSKSAEAGPKEKSVKATKTKGKVPEGVLVKEYAPPKQIAILPMNNISNDLQAPVIARELVRTNLLRKGYAIVDEDEVDTALKEKLGITDGGQLNVSSPQKIGEVLGVAGLVYGTIEQFKFVPLAAYNERTAEIKLSLVRTSDGVKLFENKKKASDKTVELTKEGMVKSAKTTVAEKIIPQTSQTTKEILKAGLTAFDEEELAQIQHHPLSAITASAINKCLRTLPPTPTGMKDFGGRTWDEIGNDERSTCITIEKVNPAFGVWAGTEIDIFRETPLCYKPTGLPNYDSFFDKVNLFVADIRLASAIAYMVKSGKVTASNGLPFDQAATLVVYTVDKGVENAKQMVQEGSGLVSSAPSQFSGMNALKLPQILKSLKLSIQNLTTALKEGKEVLAELKGEPVPQDHQRRQ